MKKNKNNINIPNINSSNNKFSVLYNLKSIYEKKKIKDISKLNKIIYKIGDKSNLSKSSKKEIGHFLKKQKNLPQKKKILLYLFKYQIKLKHEIINWIKSSFLKYRKIIINNKVKKPINIKLNSLRIPNLKDNSISNINSFENEDKLNSVPNKKHLINIMTLMELKHKK